MAMRFGAESDPTFAGSFSRWLISSILWWRVCDSRVVGLRTKLAKKWIKAEIDFMVGSAFPDKILVYLEKYYKTTCIHI